MFWWGYYLSRVARFFLYFLSFFVGTILIKILLSGKVYFVEWCLMDFLPVDVNISFVFDWIGIRFSSLVLFISASVLWFSSSYIEGDLNLRRFIWLVLLFVASMNLLVYIPNLIAILLGWDGLGLVRFLLVIYYQNYKSFSAGILTVLINRIGDVILLLRIGWFVVQGHWNIFCCFSSTYSFVLIICVILAAITKRAQIPFSRWLPAAIAAPTPVSALVHSSTLVTAGVFLLIRFFNFLREYEYFCYLLMFISVITIFIAGLRANIESDLKKIIALSTLSQLGVMIFRLSISLPLLALFHLYTHALFKALLFLCAGSVIHACQHAQDLRFVGRLRIQIPVSISCLNIANIALCGSPFLAGFYSKDIILERFVFNPWNFLIFFIVFLATGFTARYSIRLRVISLWNTFRFFPFHNLSDEDYRIITPIIFLVTGAIISGRVFRWFFFDFFSLIILPIILKVFALFSTITGGILGWQISNSVNVFRKSNFSLFGYSSVSIWYLVYLSTQYIIYFPLKLRFNFLYFLDRGWNEIFGGKGLGLITKQRSSYVISWQTSIYIIYISLIVISYVIIFFIILVFFN